MRFVTHGEVGILEMGTNGNDPTLLTVTLRRSIASCLGKRTTQ